MDQMSWQHFSIVEMGSGGGGESGGLGPKSMNGALEVKRESIFEILPIARL